MSLSSVVLRIGHYHYLRDDILGEGSTGKVYLGKYQHMKVLTKEHQQRWLSN